ncbi:hypothetical protein ID866_6547 [Astraeus odoratus]|nr:hypothetical protein ID866_6547 [Astraeus odoratus]
MDPASINAHFERIGRFRVLVIGRANAGKTTLLRKVCNTIEMPEVFDGKGNKRGCHNIENELVFRSNPSFIFHDSCGFETGSIEELKAMEEFVTNRSMTMKLENRIHAIWYCIPANDHARLVTVAEEEFFNKCNTGSVPVIALLTKADYLNGVAIGELIEGGKSMKEAMQCSGDVEKKLLQKAENKIVEKLRDCNFPPKCYLSLAKMHEESSACTNLLSATANALDKEALQMLLISTQQANILLNIEWAVKKLVKWF